jgi:hypothetical protein
MRPRDAEDQGIKKNSYKCDNINLYGPKIYKDIKEESMNY